ncbi:MAG: hypothetical protein AAF160_04135 [Pseudomonadota bacterium]
MIAFLGGLTARLIGLSALGSAYVVFLTKEQIFRGYTFHWLQFREALVEILAILILVPFFLIPPATRWLYERQAMADFAMVRLGPLLLMIFAAGYGANRTTFFEWHWLGGWGVLGLLYIFFFVFPGRYARGLALGAPMRIEEEPASLTALEAVGRGGHKGDWRNLDSLKPQDRQAIIEAVALERRAGALPRRPSLPYLRLTILAVVPLVAMLGLWALLAPGFLPRAGWVATADKLTLPLALGLALVAGLAFTAMPRFSPEPSWIVKRCGPVFGNQIRFLGGTAVAFLLLINTLGPALAISLPALQAQLYFSGAPGIEDEAVVSVMAAPEQDLLALIRCAGWATVQWDQSPGMPVCLGTPAPAQRLKLVGPATTRGIQYERVSPEPGT